MSEIFARLSAATTLRELKAAYAAELRSIDTERDPASFIILRQTYESLRETMGQMLQLENSPLPTTSDPISFSSEQMSERQTDDLLSSASTLINAVKSGDALADAALSNIDAVLDIMANQTASRLLVFEHWMYEHILSAGNLYAPLAFRGTAFFGWGAPQAGDRPEFQELAKIVEAANAHAFSLALDDPDHRHHTAYKLLQSDPANLDFDNLPFEMIKPVQSLIIQISASYPSIKREIGRAKIEGWLSNIRFMQSHQAALEHEPLTLIDLNFSRRWRRMNAKQKRYYASYFLIIFVFIAVPTLIVSLAS